jgi:muramidase (phage lysozyme)
MNDLGQALSELKSLPDAALQRELSSPTGMLPDYMILGELHDRKNMRLGGSGKPTSLKPKSLAEEYAGDFTKYMPQPQQTQQSQQPIPPMGGSSPPMGGQMPPRALGGNGISSLPAPTQGYARGGITTLPSYDGRVDPRLLKILDRAAHVTPYDVRFTSGFRKGPRQHGQGTALDVQLYDPRTGKAYDNYKSSKYFSDYQQLANEARRVQMEMYPELNRDFRWGGYFSGGHDVYGGLDEMHFDVGGGQMAGGSWDQGISPEQARLYNIAMDQNHPYHADGGAMHPEERALLEAIAHGEAKSYRDLYGGGHFDDFSKHPGTRIPIPNSSAYSSAAGYYQITQPTYNEFGGGSFYPADQDAMALKIANKTYGPGMVEALRSGDPNKIAEVGQRLHGRWPSINDQFGTLFKNNLTAGPVNRVQDSGATQSAEPTSPAQVAEASEAATAKSGGGMDDYFLMQMVNDQLKGQQTQQTPQPQQPQQDRRPITPFNPFAFMQDPAFMMKRTRT